MITGSRLTRKRQIIAYMKTMQYTIRKVPLSIDKGLRIRARRERKSLNTVVVETLRCGLGIDGNAVRHNDLDDLAGTWVSDPEFDKVMTAFDKIDGSLWK